MGISGHMLGERKLRALQRATGIPFDRAYNRNGFGSGRVVGEGACTHLAIEFTRSGPIVYSVQTGHWSSCGVER